MSDRIEPPSDSSPPSGPADVWAMRDHAFPVTPRERIGPPSDSPLQRDESMTPVPLSDSWRRAVARPLHRLAHLLDRVGWWFTEYPERRRKREMADE